MLRRGKTVAIFIASDTENCQRSWALLKATSQQTVPIDFLLHTFQACCEQAATMTAAGSMMVPERLTRQLRIQDLPKASVSSGLHR